MRTLQCLDRYFPARELELQRLLRNDAEFRALCEDFRDAVEARERFTQRGPAETDRANEYRTLADELAAQIETCLRRAPAVRTQANSLHTGQVVQTRRPGQNGR